MPDEDRFICNFLSLSRSLNASSSTETVFTFCEMAATVASASSSVFLSGIKMVTIPIAKSKPKSEIKLFWVEVRGSRIYLLSFQPVVNQKAPTAISVIPKAKIPEKFPVYRTL